VARDEPGQWLLPNESLWPKGTEVVSDMSVETPMEPSQGCLIPQLEETSTIDEVGRCTSAFVLTIGTLYVPYMYRCLTGTG
jgi:hypothetical protein